MKKYFFAIFVIMLALTGCVSKSTSRNETTNQETSTGSSHMASSGSTTETEKTKIDWMQKMEKIDLAENLCVGDICLESKKPTYKTNDGSLVQASIVLENSDDGDTSEIKTIPKKEYKTLEYLERIKLDGSPNEREEYDFPTYAKIDEWTQKKGDHEGEYVIRKVILSPDQKTITEEFDVTLSSEAFSVTKISDNLTLKTYSTAGCASAFFLQRLYDANGKEVTFADSFQNIPKQLARLPFLLSFDEETTKTFSDSAVVIGDASESVYQFQKPISLAQIQNNELNTEEMEEVIGQFGYYVFQFEEYPGVSFAYKNNFAVADKYLTGSLANVPLNENKEIASLEDTKKILSEVFIEKRLHEDNASLDDVQLFLRKKGDVEDYEGLKLKNISKEHLPLFRVIKVRENEALLYLNPKYERFTLAEFCKPVVYVYDKNQTPNALSIDLPQGGKYTKLIPEFSRPNTWNFKTNVQSVVSVDNNQFDYLYYSVRVPNYQFNKNGWQVYGRDMYAFLSQKLDYIGFNTKEKQDFLDFWKTEFHDDQLYFVSFKFDDELEKYASLHFARKPYSQMRVLLEAYPLRVNPNPKFLYPNASQKIDAKLLKQFVRSGEYDVFEWGGVVQTDFDGELIIR